MPLDRYALVVKTPTGWAIDSEEFLIFKNPGPKPWSSEDGERYLLPVEQELKSYDEELWQQYLDGYHIEGDRVVERFRYEPTPNFRQVLNDRASRLLEGAWKKVINLTPLQVLELHATLFEAQECQKLLEQGFEPELGEFRCLDALIGTTYVDPALGEITVDSPQEAAQFVFKDYFSLRRHFIAEYKHKRLEIKRVIENATAEVAAEYVESLRQEIEGS